MDRIAAPIGESLENVARANAPAWVMILLAVVMFAGWTATYIAIILKSRRDRAYGIPFPNTCLNFTWELIFAFNLAGGLPPFAFPLRLGHLFWLLPNGFNVYYTLKFGPGMQTAPLMRRHFRLIFLAAFVALFAMLYTYHSYARDVYGVASAWIINVLMSWLFLRMYLNRRSNITADGTIRGMSLPSAWFKLIGNAAGAVFCVLWWPAQFSDGVLVHQGITVAEPESYLFLNVLYTLNILLDVALIWLLRARLQEIRAGGTEPGLPDHALRLV